MYLALVVNVFPLENAMLTDGKQRASLRQETANFAGPESASPGNLSDNASCVYSRSELITAHSRRAMVGPGIAPASVGKPDVGADWKRAPRRLEGRSRRARTIVQVALQSVGERTSWRRGSSSGRRRAGRGGSGRQRATRGAPRSRSARRCGRGRSRAIPRRVPSAVATASPACRGHRRRGERPRPVSRRWRLPIFNGLLRRGVA